MTDNKNVTNDHCLCKLMQGFKVKQGLNEDCLYKKNDKPLNTQASHR